MIKKYLIWVSLLIIIIAILVISNPQEVQKAESIFKCPEEMGNFEEYINNRADVAELIKKENSNLSEEEIVTEVMKMGDKRGCSNDVAYLNEYMESAKGQESPLYLISDEEMSEQKLLEYNTDFGFSFKYPDYTEVLDVREGTVWFVVSPKGNENRKIIISVAENNENITAKEWFLGPNSGFNEEKSAFFSTKIDGQDAVYTDGGAWLVVNTPDNKYRLSIAELTMENEEIMYKEMGIIFKTLDFK